MLGGLVIAPGVHYKDPLRVLGPQVKKLCTK